MKNVIQINFFLKSINQIDQIDFFDKFKPQLSNCFSHFEIRTFN